LDEHELMESMGLEQIITHFQNGRKSTSFIMNTKIEFNQTSTLRLLSVLCLCISDLCLIKDRWRYFFLFFLLMVSIELFRAKLYKALLHHHETTIRIEKL
jgi:hypothetical protein